MQQSRRAAFAVDDVVRYSNYVLYRYDRTVNLYDGPSPFKFEFFTPHTARACSFLSSLLLLATGTLDRRSETTTLPTNPLHYFHSFQKMRFQMVSSWMTFASVVLAAALAKVAGAVDKADFLRGRSPNQKRKMREPVSSAHAQSAGEDHIVSNPSRRYLQVTNTTTPATPIGNYSTADLEQNTAMARERHPLGVEERNEAGDSFFLFNIFAQARIAEDEKVPREILQEVGTVVLSSGGG